MTPETMALLVATIAAGFYLGLLWHNQPSKRQ
jgi:hypothetical protein